MDWTTGRLTTREAERALRQAGINPDFAEWSSEDQHRAAELLDAARNRTPPPPKPVLAYAVYAVDCNDAGRIVSWAFISDYPNAAEASREASRRNKGRLDRMFRVARHERGLNVNQPIWEEVQ